MLLCSNPACWTELKPKLPLETETREEIVECRTTKSNSEVKESVLTFEREPPFALFIDHDI